MKIIKLILVLFFIFFQTYAESNTDFNDWLISFKKTALKKGVSEKTFNEVMMSAKFLPKVIEYDRYQPEFYEDTITYITKRTSSKKVTQGLKLYKNNKKLIDSIEKEFSVEKELLLALMGIETNFGKYLGKMDIISSLATLSFDKRRSKFFTNELVKILLLIDKNIIDHKILYGSWAGAFGNFQFMPSTITMHAIDYNKNNKIELKSIEDSFASAANYINKMGWDMKGPCFIEVDLNDNTPTYLLNTSARKIKNKKKLKTLKKYIKKPDVIDLNNNIKAAIITPDKDIVPDANELKPAYIVFRNYDLILKWNRSLRFGLAVCYLKNKFKNEL